MKAFTDVVEWLLAMRNFADKNPDLFWMSGDLYPYIGYLACDRDDPDPDHVRRFIVTLGAIRRASEGEDEFAERCRRYMKNPLTRAKLAEDLNNSYHPLFSALLDKAEGASDG